MNSSNTLPPMVTVCRARCSTSVLTALRTGSSVNSCAEITSIAASDRTRCLNVVPGIDTRNIRLSSH